MLFIIREYRNTSPLTHTVTPLPAKTIRRELTVGLVKGSAVLARSNSDGFYYRGI